MQTLRSFRRRFLMEPLEHRWFLTIVPIDATAGVPFEGIVATDLRLPDYATGLGLINVMINGQWDYYPTAHVQPDGSFDLHVKMTPQRSGTDTMHIIFRSNRTGGWDTLESGPQTVKPGHFDVRRPDESKYNLLPGTLMRGAVATFTRTELTRALDEYVVEVDWLGKTHAGHLAQSDDGSIGAFVPDAYVPIDGYMNVYVTIRLAGAAPDAPAVGYARTYLSTSGSSIGFGFFQGWSTQTVFSINLPKDPLHPDWNHGFFRPVAEVEDWQTTFTAQINWDDKSGNIVLVTSGTVVRRSDGSYAVMGNRPGSGYEHGQIKIYETVQRPAIGGMPAERYTVIYVGSFDVSAEKPAGESEEIPAEQPTEQPEEQPTEQPTDQPTERPTETPSEQPGKQPAPTEGEGPSAPDIMLGGFGGSTDGGRFSALFGSNSFGGDAQDFGFGAPFLFGSDGDDDAAETEVLPS